MSTKTKKLVEIAVAVAKIFGWICRFLPLDQKNAIVTLAISEVTGSILIIFAFDVATILKLNIFESKLPYF